MKKATRKIRGLIATLFAFILAATAVGLAACSSSSDGTKTSTDLSIGLNYYEKTIEPGDSFALVATVTGSHSSGYEWTSNSSIVTLAADNSICMVTAGANTGTAKVTLTIDNLSATCNVTVAKKATAESITFNPTALTLTEGETEEIEVIVTMSDGTTSGDFSLSFVSDGNVIEVETLTEGRLRVKALSVGDATITVTARGTNGAVSGTVNVTVKAAAAHEHEYVVSEGAVWTWSDDHTTCTATASCTNEDGECGEKAITVYADISSVDTDPTCTEGGCTTYTATYNGGTVSTEKVETSEALGHDYQESWSWGLSSSDENADLVATLDLSCSRCDYVWAGNATVTQKERDTDVYVATITNPEGDTFTDEHEMDGAETVIHTHSYEYVESSDPTSPNYTWSDDGKSCQLTLTCTTGDGTTCTTPSVSVAATMSSTTTKAATCGEDGTEVYTASYNGTTVATNEVTIPATGDHQYSQIAENDIQWNWAADHLSCTASASVTCSVCQGTYTYADTVTTSSTTQDATCTTDGKTTYTAVVTLDGTEYGKTYEEKISAKGHMLSYVAANAATCVENGNSEYFVCTVCGTLFSDEYGQNETTADAVMVAATGNHTYVVEGGEDAWTWTAEGEGYTTTATGTCSVCGATATLTAEVSSTATDSSCETAGYTTYTATYNGSIVSTKIVEGEPATGHSYTVVWDWVENATMGTWSISSGYGTCTVCGAESTPSVTCTEAKGDTASGITAIYTATAVFSGGETYTDVKTVYGDAKVSADFSDGDTYSWIETVEGDTVKSGTTFTNGILSFAEGGAGATLIDSSAGTLTTADVGSSGWGYFAIDLTNHEGFYLEVEALITSGSGTTSSLYIVTSNTSLPSSSLKGSGDTLAYAETRNGSNYNTLYYNAEIESGAVLYIVWDASVNIFSLDISVTGTQNTVKHVHTYNYDEAPEFTWSATAVGYTVSANLTCTDEHCPDTDKGIMTGTATAAVDGQNTTAPTCTTKGANAYTAEIVINGITYTSSRTDEVEMLEHGYPDDAVESDAEYIAWQWSTRSDGTVTLQVTCKTGGELLINTSVTYSQGDNNTLTATYTDADGHAYTGTYEVPESEQHIHSYTEIESWEWSDDDDTCTVTLKCTSDVGETCTVPTVTYDATVTFITTTEPGCETEGTGYYQATYVLNGATQTNSETRQATIPAIGHDYDTTNPVWTWGTVDANGTVNATLSFVCINDSTHVWRSEYGPFTAVRDSETSAYNTYDVYTASGVGPDGETAFTDTYRRAVSVKVDFAQSESYSWISYTADSETATTLNINTTSASAPYTDEFLSLAPTSSGMAIRSETGRGALQTGGTASATGNGRYLAIDLSGYVGEYVSVTVEMSNTGNNAARHLILTTAVTSSLEDTGVLAYVESTADGSGHQTLTYVIAITEDTPTLYLTWDNSIYIYSIEIEMGRDMTPTAVATAVALSTEREIIRIAPNGSEKATIAAVVTIPGDTYEGGYTWTVTETPDEENGSVLTYVENGDGTLTVTAVGYGTAEISVRLWNAPWLTDIITLTVAYPFVGEWSGTNIEASALGSTFECPEVKLAVTTDGKFELYVNMEGTSIAQSLDFDYIELSGTWTLKSEDNGTYTVSLYESFLSTGTITITVGTDENGDYISATLNYSYMLIVTITTDNIKLYLQ